MTSIEKNINWETCSSTSDNDRVFLEATRDAFMSQLVQTPTRGRGTAEPSIIDLIFSSDEENFDDITFCAPLGKSDHALIKSKYQFKPTKRKGKITHDYKKADYVKMREFFIRDWDTDFQNCKDDINLLWDTFKQIYDSAITSCVPLKKISYKHTSKHLLDRKSLSVRRRKFRLWKRYLESGDSDIYKDYCRCRNQLRRETRKASKKHEKNIASKIKTDSKLFWKFINSKTKMKSAIPDLHALGHEDVIISDDKEKADILGKFFASVYTNEPNWTWELKEEITPEINVDVNLDITLDMVKKGLSKLDKNKSPGPDKINIAPLVELHDVIAYPLWYIFNASLKYKEIPISWKNAVITPIFKQKGSKKNPENYRPVSLTSVVSKLMETFVRESLLTYLKTNNVLSNKQYGFLRGRSTVLQLLNVIDTWVEIIDKGGTVDTIFCDFQKAFDSVPHKRLIDILSFYGVKDPLLSWIKSFLSDRKHVVSVNGCFSESFDVLSGVPQGSVLGPILFIIYINFMITKAESSNMFLYADDLKIFRQINSIEDGEALQNDLDNLYDWTRYSLLKFHPQKCVSMRLETKYAKALPFKCFYNMDETRLKVVKAEKDLGIIVDSKLGFVQHIDSIVKKATSLSGMIKRTFSYMDKHMFKIIFTSIVRPHLEYGAVIWNPHLKKLINQIENVQRRATKFIPGFGNLTYKERLISLGLPTLVYRRYRGDMIELYKLSHNMYDPEVSKDFLNFTVSRARGHRFNLRKQDYKTDLKKFSFRHRTVDQWNNLPERVVEAASLNAFKNNLDKLWIPNDIMYDSDIDLWSITSRRATRYLRT